MLLLWGSYSENQGPYLEVEFLGHKIHLVQPCQKAKAKLTLYEESTHCKRF